MCYISSSIIFEETTNILEKTYFHFKRQLKQYILLLLMLFLIDIDVKNKIIVFFYVNFSTVYSFIGYFFIILFLIYLS